MNMIKVFQLIQLIMIQRVKQILHTDWFRVLSSDLPQKIEKCATLIHTVSQVVFNCFSFVCSDLRCHITFGVVGVRSTLVWVCGIMQRRLKWACTTQHPSTSFIWNVICATISLRYRLILRWVLIKIYFLLKKFLVFTIFHQWGMMMSQKLDVSFIELHKKLWNGIVMARFMCSIVCVQLLLTPVYSMACPQGAYMMIILYNKIYYTNAVYFSQKERGKMKKTWKLWNKMHWNLFIVQNFTYVIVSGARRKEERWNAADNEQIVTEGMENHWIF